MDTATTLWGLLFGAVGAGYFVYGKKQGAWVPLCCGLALMVFSYFIANVWLMVGVGILLCGIPYFYRP